MPSQPVEGLTMRRFTVAVVLAVLACASCTSSSDEWGCWKRKSVRNGYSLAKSSAGSYCVASDDALILPCGSTVEVSEIGVADRYVAVRINVPSKEFLLIDTVEHLVWVLDAAAFKTTPEAQGVKMVEVEQAWSQLQTPSERT
jgi:hypothetical protein